MRILLVEDDKLLGDGIKTGLRHFSYAVDWVETGQFALSAIQTEAYELIILDLGLPDIDGIKLVQKIRKYHCNSPILILTARDQLEDKLSGLNAGADDYMVKPFDMRELEARIRVLSRRQHGLVEDDISIGPLSLNLAAYHAHFNGEKLNLSRREFQLMRVFVEQPNRVLSRAQLEQLAYSWNDGVESNAVEVHIHNLRKKLHSNTVIKTIRGVGYMLNTDVLG